MLELSELVVTALEFVVILLKFVETEFESISMLLFSIESFKFLSF